MVVAALTLSLRRAAWITPRLRDTLGVKATLLIILHCYVKRICATRLRFEQRSQRSRLERRQRPFPSTLARAHTSHRAFSFFETVPASTCEALLGL